MPKTEEMQNMAGNKELSFDDFKKTVGNDYRIACESREASLLGRKEVLSGKAKFGIFGDGKEIAQIAMAKAFKGGDFRSGYYRDQTFAFAAGILTVQQWFSGLYAHADIHAEPMSAGRQMGGHFATHTVNDDGTWADLINSINSSSDISPTGGQMPRLLGLALASKSYRNIPLLHTPEFSRFSSNGDEIAFGTIGDASTSEGLFWETLNAAGVMQIPMLLSVWDDGYGISVPKKYQTVKADISEALKGFQRDKKNAGYEIYKVKGWDYPELCETYRRAAELCRAEHTPVILHVEEVTQPQGHSTSGSHERYKSPERLQWEKDFDCITKMRQWMLKFAIATEEELTAIEQKAKAAVKQAKDAAWNDFTASIKREANEAVSLIEAAAPSSAHGEKLTSIATGLKSTKEPLRRDISSAVRQSLRILATDSNYSRKELSDYADRFREQNIDRYDSLLYTNEALSVPPAAVTHEQENSVMNGFEVLRENFDALLAKHPNLIIFGEDVGRLGDVNQGLENLQKKYGEYRVFDTGIREATIIGQAIGMAMRGLRPIAEIQYLDYLLYALQIMSDDLATLAYRTKGKQRAPVIVRTRGHRLEGIWHSGSPMSMVINSLRGMYVCVPRNMTQAAGFYNTLLAANEPALVIEPLNSYRLKERKPMNFGEFKVPLGMPEILREGTDVTVVTYGPLCRMAMEAAVLLQETGISSEVIDVQTLLPFDLNHTIAGSIAKTNRVLFLDEDVPGGCTAYMLQQALEVQNGYKHLDSAPKTLTAKAHRPAYGSDGDYYSKPSVDDIYEAVYEIMSEAQPERFPGLA